MTEPSHMMVEGYAVPSEVAAAALNEIRSRCGFTAGEIKSVLLGLGVPDAPVQPGHLFGPAHRVADRLLQSERRAGRIVFRQGRWHRKNPQPWIR